MAGNALVALMGRTFNPNEVDQQVAQTQFLEGKNKLFEMQVAESQKALQQENALNQLYKSAVKSDGTVDQNTLYTGLAQGGLGSRIPAVQKQYAELAEKQADAAKKNADAQKTGLESANLALTQHRAMLNNVNDIQSARQWLTSAYANPDTKGIFERFGPLEEALSRFDSSVRDPQSFAKWKMGASMNADELVKYTTPDANTVANNQTSRANNAATNAVTMRGQNLTDARARERLDYDRSQPKGQVVQTEQGTMLVDQRTGQAIPVTVSGKSIPSKENQQKITDAKGVLNILDEADKLIDKSTNSLVGRGLDFAAGSVGYGTEGAQASAQLKALEGNLISKMPKMSGPQSDRDVELYRQMAGQIGDPTVPRANKKAAMQTIRSLNEKYLVDQGVDVPKQAPKKSLDEIFGKK